MVRHLKRLAGFASAFVLAACATPASTVTEQFGSLTASRLTSLPMAEYRMAPESSEIGFSVKPIGLSEMKGQFQFFDGVVNVADASKGDVSLVADVDLSSVSMGNGTFEDMVKSPAWFDVKNHPKARFDGRLEGWGDDGSSFVAGNMTIRGVTKPERFTIALTCDAVSRCPEEAVGFRGEIEVSRSAYGMNKMTRMVDDKVRLTIAGTLVRDSNSSQHASLQNQRQRQN